MAIIKETEILPGYHVGIDDCVLRIPNHDKLTDGGFQVREMTDEEHAALRLSAGLDPIPAAEIEKNSVLHAGETPPAWTFKDDKVAEKFDDHVREQLPWYDALSSYVCDLAISFLPQRGVLYDIGASTGNITKRLTDDLASKNAIAISIEPSHQMTKLFEGTGELWAIDAEAIDYDRRPPDVAVLFLTLMFMRPAERMGFLSKLFEAIEPGGAVILIDKGYLHDARVQVACKSAQLAGKRRSGTPGDAYVTKELALRGEQRPTDDKRIIELAFRHNLDGEEIFRFGEFYGLLLVKQAL